MEDKSYFLTCEVYKQMSQDFYNNYKYFSNEKSKLYNGKDWDYYEHTNKENDKFLCYHQSKHRSAITSLIFQALAVEVYVNYYCYKCYGDEFFNNKQSIELLKLMGVE